MKNTQQQKKTEIEENKTHGTNVSWIDLSAQTVTMTTHHVICMHWGHWVDDIFRFYYTSTYIAMIYSILNDPIQCILACWELGGRRWFGKDRKKSMTKNM